MIRGCQRGAISAKNKNRGNVPTILNIDNVTATFHKNQYIDQPINITSVQSPIASVTGYRWEIRDSETKNIVGLQFNTPNPSFIVPPKVGWLDLILTAYNDGDQFVQEWEECMFQDLPRFTMEECDRLIDSSTFYEDFGSIARPGLKIGIMGNINGYVQLHNCWGGPNPEDYVRVQTFGNPTITVPSGTFHGIRVDGDCRYIRFNCFQPDGTIGLTVIGHPSNSTQTIMNMDRFTNIEYMGVKTMHSHVTQFQGAAFSFIPTTSDTLNATNWVIDKVRIFGCHIVDANEEGIYAGYNNDNLQGANRPAKLRDAIFMWNLIENAGRDGIQPGGCVNVRVHSNTILGWGFMKHAGHESAFSWNGGNYGLCYKNYCVGGKMFVNFQSGNCPWDIAAGQTSPRPSKFFSNFFANGVFDNTGGGAEPFNCYGQTWINVSGVINWMFFNNTFVCDRKFMEIWYHANGFTSDNIVVANNIIIAPLTAGTTNEVNLNGPGTRPTPSQYTINNLFRITGNTDDLKFIDPSDYDYHIKDFGSPAYLFGTPSNIATLFPELAQYYKDADGMPLLAPAQRYTWGAYSGYNWRLIPFVPSDPLPASFTTTPNMSNTNFAGGTLTFKADKVGVLYYTFTSTSDPGPTKAQLRAGAYGSSSGSLVDIGDGNTRLINTLVEATSYKLWYLFVTYDNVEQVSIGSTTFTTSADLTAPHIVSARITDANRNRIELVFDEPVTGGTITGFTLTNTGKTITGITTSPGSTTGYYFTVSTPFSFGEDPLLNYTSGSGITDVASAHNPLGAFSNMVITNLIAAAPVENVVWTARHKATASDKNTVGDQLGNNLSSTGTPDSGARSTKIAPSGAGGYIAFDWNTQMRSDAGGARIGIAKTTTDLSTYEYTDLIVSIDIRATNSNIDLYQGGTYKFTVGGYSEDGRTYRFRWDEQGYVYFESTISGNTWTLHYTFNVSGVNTVLVDSSVYAYVSFGDATRAVFDVKLQSDVGLV